MHPHRIAAKNGLDNRTQMCSALARWVGDSAARTRVLVFDGILSLDGFSDS